MKKILLILLLLISTSLYAQEDLFKADIGYSTGGAINIDIAAIRKGLYYGIDLQPNLRLKEKGEYYSTVNSGEFTEDIQNEGYINDGILFDLGYCLSNRFLYGVGIGIGFKEKYQNRYDSSEILGNDGKYHTEKDEGVLFAYQPFVEYNIDNNLHNSFYLKLQCSNILGAALSIGYNF